MPAPVADGTPRRVPSVGAYELWMLAQAAIGFCGVGGMMFLIPAFVLAQGGSPADAGAVMALAGALALSGPFLGNTADRFGIHRGLQLASIALLGAAAVSFAFAEQQLLWLVAASLLGLGMAGLTVVNATFVVGAGFDEQVQAKKLSLLQLSLPAGQVLGLAAMSALAGADVSFEGRFVFLAACAGVFAVAVAAVNRSAAQRMSSLAPTDAGSTAAAGNKIGAAEGTDASLRSIVFSQFGLVLGLVVLIMVSAQAIESQYPNYMQSAFNVDPTESAGALSLIVLISIPLYILAGRWTAKSGPWTPFLVSAAARATAGAGLLLLPGDAGLAALVVFGIVMVVYPLFELNAATLAAATSPIGPGGGQGAVGAAMAMGTIIAAVLAGWVADQIGFSALAAITLIAAGAATLIGVFVRKSAAAPAP